MDKKEPLANNLTNAEHEDEDMKITHRKNENIANIYSSKTKQIQ